MLIYSYIRICIHDCDGSRFFVRFYYHSFTYNLSESLYIFTENNVTDSAIECSFILS